jgi:hypothetical protein
VVSVVKPNWIFRLLCFWKSCFCSELHMTPELKCRDINLWPISECITMSLVSTLKGRANKRTGLGCDFSGDRKINPPLLQPRCDSRHEKSRVCIFIIPSSSEAWFSTNSSSSL